MKVHYPHVLIAAPTSDKKLYCQEDFIKNIKSFTYPNYSILLVDNSDTQKNCRRLSKLGINTFWVKPKKDRGIIETIAMSHEAIRKFVVQKNIPYLLHLETDIFPIELQNNELVYATDVIQRLLLNKKSVCHAPYYIGHGSKRQLGILMQDGGKFFKFVKPLGSEMINFIDGTIKPCFHAGLGCALIHIDVLKKIKFRWVKGYDTFPDYWFAKDLMDEAITNWVDTSLLCEHRNKDWGVFGIDYK